MDDWYNVSKSDIKLNGGEALLQKYDRLPSKMLQEIYPDHKWLPWRFEGYVPPRTWHDPSMQKEFLEKILRRNGIEEKDILKITEYASQKYSQICNILENCSLEDEVLLPPREEFEKFPAVLSLSELFYEKEVKYSYEEYCEHIEMTRAFAKTHPNYRLSLRILR